MRTASAIVLQRSYCWRRRKKNVIDDICAVLTWPHSLSLNIQTLVVFYDYHKRGNQKRESWQNLIISERHKTRQFICQRSCQLDVFSVWPLSPHNAEIFVCKRWRSKGYFQFEVIIHDLFAQFCSAVLWVYSHYSYFSASVGGPSSDVRIWRL